MTKKLLLKEDNKKTESVSKDMKILKKR